MLSEQRRSDLDKIVQDMIQNKESDSNIRFVIDDYKNKYSNEQLISLPTPDTTGGSLNKRGKQFIEASDLPTNAAGKVIPATGAVLGGAADILQKPIEPVVGAGVTALTSVPFSPGWDLKQILTSPQGQQLIQKTQESVQGIKNNLEQIKKSHPVIAANLQGLLDIGNFILTASGVESVGKELLGKGGQTVVSSGVSSIKTGAKETSGSLSDYLATNLNRLPKNKLKEFYSMQGKSLGSWLNERGLTGKPVETIDNLAGYFIQSKNKVDKALNQIKGTYNRSVMPKQFGAMIDDAVRFAKETDDKVLGNLLNLQKKSKEVGLDMTEINKIKRYFERNNKFTYGKDLTGAEKTKWATNIDNAVREWQFNEASMQGFKNLPELNKETQASKFILDNLSKEQQALLGNNQITLTDWIIGAGRGWQDLLLKKVLTGQTARSTAAKILNTISGRGIKDVQPLLEIQNRLGLPQAGTTPIPLRGATEFEKAAEIIGKGLKK